ncbi:carboxylate--amine ligase [Intrasporangium oryzae NRRL B-24470]|uniref:Putative glutamate--cysteine ligase 2 n=1 Tax=Intrasporangium oryzae NRRL B-24470 TaxID=1386089 RepID=W9G722_9MICO|nr:glutamate--cysteine ligase [Intrasporangium oryzae]EWT00608.1 carboxylate--amine ligase [Intrasporangium oryzae NRRL B-24470]
MRTMGVEEEMLLVDIRNGRPRSVSGRLLIRAAQHPAPVAGVGVHGALEGEFKQQQIETHTRPVSDLDTLRREVRRWRTEAIDAARESGSSVAALATSPLRVKPTPVASPRYAWMQERYALTAREHLTCGLHVHVSVESDEEGVAVIDRIRVWMSTLLALSANSPYWKGDDSGFASYRARAMAKWPAAGPTDLFGSAAVYHQLVRDMTLSSVILDAGMVYFDARLSHHYPTVEIRVADVCPSVEETVVIAGLCRALVETAASEWAAGEPPPPVPTLLLRLGAWQASREGIDGVLLDPFTSRPVPAWDVVDRLVDHVRPALKAAGDLEAVEDGLERLRREGNGAIRQRRMYERTGQLVDVVAHAVRVTAGLEDAP